MKASSGGQVWSKASSAKVKCGSGSIEETVEAANEWVQAKLLEKSQMSPLRVTAGAAAAADDRLAADRAATDENEHGKNESGEHGCATPKPDDEVATDPGSPVPSQEGRDDMQEVVDHDADDGNGGTEVADDDENHPTKKRRKTGRSEVALAPETQQEEVPATQPTSGGDGDMID